MPDDNRTQGPSNDAPRDPLDDLIAPILGRDVTPEPRNVPTLRETSKQSRRNPLDELVTDAELRAEASKAAARSVTLNQGRRNPLDDLLSDAELRTESRKSPATSRPVQARAGRRVLKSTPVSVFVIAGMLLLLFGMLLGVPGNRMKDIFSAPPAAVSEPVPVPTVSAVKAIPTPVEKPTAEADESSQFAPAFPDDKPITIMNQGIEIANPRGDNRRQVESLPKNGTPTPVIERVEQSVVLIRTQKGQPIGSGFVFDSDKGVVVTNWHVVEGERDLVVEFFDGQTENVLGFFSVSQDNDLATLSVGVQVQRYPRLELAEHHPSKGDDVLAFGSPLGFKGSVTKGIVGAIRKASEIPHAGFGQWIQHSAPNSPGNSGGPLVNADGKVVGVNTQGIKAEFGQNINFAIAALHIREVVRDGFNEPKRLVDLPVRDKAKLPAANPAKLLDDEDSLKESQRHIASGVMRRALQTLDDIPAENRGPRYWRVRATALFSITAYREAADCLSKSIKLDNSDLDTWIRYALSLHLRPKDELAIAEWRSRRPVESVLATYVDDDLILAACRSALKIAPNDSRPYLLMGLSLRNNEERIDAFKAALSLDPDDIGVHYQLGCAFVLRRKDDVRKHFKKAMDLVGKLGANYEIINRRPDNGDIGRGGWEDRLNQFSERNSLETFLKLNLAAAYEDDARILICREVLKSEPKNRVATHMIRQAMKMMGRITPGPNEYLFTPSESWGELSLSSGTTGLLIFRK